MNVLLFYIGTVTLFIFYLTLSSIYSYTKTLQILFILLSIYSDTKAMIVVFPEYKLLNRSYNKVHFGK